MLPFDGRRAFAAAVAVSVLLGGNLAFMIGPVSSTSGDAYGGLVGDVRAVRSAASDLRKGVDNLEMSAWASIDLGSIHSYEILRPGTVLQFVVYGSGFDSFQASIDGSPFADIPASGWGEDEAIYLIDTSPWSEGMHVLQVRVVADGIALDEERYVFLVDSTVPTPLDTFVVDVILLGFDVDPDALLGELVSRHREYVQLTPEPESAEFVDIVYEYRVLAADPAYAAEFLDQVRNHATFRSDVEARLDLDALIDQRDSGVPMDIFDPLIGREITSEWVEAYLSEHPPVAVPEPADYTFYLLNLESLDDPVAGTEHWFVRSNPDTDTGREQDWWRLEWDNDLNTPMGYPMNIFGGPNHRVVIDPTGYQWYLDWTYVWWEGGSGPAPYGRQYEDVPPGERVAYLGRTVNDLITGLGSDLPWAPPEEQRIKIRSFVLSGSPTVDAEDLTWTIHEEALLEYVGSFLPIKEWSAETTFAPVASFPDLASFVDSHTDWSGGIGHIDGLAVWSYLWENRSMFAPEDPDTLTILTMNFVYDDRQMWYGGRPFTGLGGGGVTAIFLQTERLFTATGMPQKGFTNTIAHETGHSLGYGHQFGLEYRADFVDGSMGYFKEELAYGTFWEDALWRVYVHGELRDLRNLLAELPPVDLWAPLQAAYRHYQDLQFAEALQQLLEIQANLTPPGPAAPLIDFAIDGDGHSLAEGDVTSSDTIIIGFSAADPTQAEGFFCALDGVWSACSSPVTYGELAEGEHRFEVYAYSASGVRGASASFHWTVVALEPVAISIDLAIDGNGRILVDGDLTVSAAVTFEFSASDPARVGGFFCALDGAWDACATLTTFVGLPPGPHTFEAYAMDLFGNLGPRASFRWTILTPAEGVLRLIDRLLRMNLSAGTTNSLLDPLELAERILTDAKAWNDLKACRQLESFVDQVDLYWSKGRLSGEQAQSLRRGATEIILSLACP